MVVEIKLDLRLEAKFPLWEWQFQMLFGYLTIGALEAVADKEQTKERPARAGKELETQTKHYRWRIKKSGKM